MSPVAQTVLLVASLMLSPSPARCEEPDYAGMLLTNRSLLTDPPKSCDTAHADLNTFELQQCAAVALREADRAMTEAYEGALTVGDPKRNDRLKQAQRTWLAFRNFECDWESLQYDGGTLAPVTMGNCLVDVTRARTKQLKQGQEP